MPLILELIPMCLSRNILSNLGREHWFGDVAEKSYDRIFRRQRNLLCWIAPGGATRQSPIRKPWPAAEATGRNATWLTQHLTRHSPSSISTPTARPEPRQ